MMLKNALVLWLLLVAGTALASPGTGAFTISGDFEAGSDEATASIFLNERINIWMLQLRADRHMVTMFFSRDFTPAAGTYPVRFNYMNAEDTLGGSVIVRGDERVMLSHDTEGSVEFEEFGERIRGTFEYTTYDASAAPRRQVTVTGSFDLPRGDALR